jgi:hypothetical protein
MQEQQPASAALHHDALLSGGLVLLGVHYVHVKASASRCDHGLCCQHTIRCHDGDAEVTQFIVS